MSTFLDHSVDKVISRYTKVLADQTPSPLQTTSIPYLNPRQRFLTQQNSPKEEEEEFSTPTGHTYNLRTKQQIRGTIPPTRQPKRKLFEKSTDKQKK